MCRRPLSIARYLAIVAKAAQELNAPMSHDAHATLAREGAKHVSKHKKRGGVQRSGGPRASHRYATTDGRRVSSHDLSATMHAMRGPRQSTANAMSAMEEYNKLKELVKNQPASIAEKREVINEHREGATIARSQVGCWSMFIYRIQIAVSRGWHTITDGFLTSVKLWDSGIKELEGAHGSHVGIYFKFLRWTLILNVVLAIMWGVFVMAPFSYQTRSVPGFARSVVEREMRPSPDGEVNRIATVEKGDWITDADGTVVTYTNYLNPNTVDGVAGLITGGLLNFTEYFIGSFIMLTDRKTGSDKLQDYSAASCDESNVPAQVLVAGDNSSANALPEPYRLGWPEAEPLTESLYYVPMAYIWCGMMTLLVSFVMLLRGVHGSFTSALSKTEHETNLMSRCVLTEYDHTLMKPSSIRIHCQDNAENVRELLGAVNAKVQYELRMQNNQYWIYFKRVLVQIVTTGITVGACVAIYYSTQKYSGETNYLSYIPSLVMAGSSAAIPFIFEALAEFEEWETGLFVIEITVVRSIVEKVAVFIFFILAIQSKIADYACWETSVGSESYIYFVVGTIIVEIFTSLGVDIMITGLHKYLGLFPQPAYFDTVKKILELSFAQAVIWFGIFFSPMLAVVGIIRCIILYYVQKFSTLKFCTQKGTPFNAGVSLPGLIWLTLGVHFVVGAVPFVYLITTNSPSGIYSANNHHFVGTLYEPSWDPEMVQLQTDEDQQRQRREDADSNGAAVDLSEAFAADVLRDPVAAQLKSKPGDNITGWCIVDTVSAAERLLWKGELSSKIADDLGKRRCEAMCVENPDVADSVKADADACDAATGRPACESLQTASEADAATAMACIWIDGDAIFLKNLFDSQTDSVPKRSTVCTPMTTKEIDEYSSPKCIPDQWIYRDETVQNKNVAGPFQGPTVNCSGAVARDETTLRLIDCEYEKSGNVRCCKGLVEEGRGARLGLTEDESDEICEPNCRADAASDDKDGLPLYTAAKAPGTLVQETLKDSDHTHGNARACAKLPNRVWVSEYDEYDVGCNDTDSTTKVCADCIINKATGLRPTEAELDSEICYSQPQKSRWLPHDCGVKLTFRDLCSKCPSGCGPFRNTENLFDVLTAGSETWKIEAAEGEMCDGKVIGGVSVTRAAINKFLKSFFEFVGSVPFTIILLLMMVALYAILRAKIASGKDIIKRLLQQREMDKVDKQWMMEEYGIKLVKKEGAKKSIASKYDAKKGAKIAREAKKGN